MGVLRLIILGCLLAVPIQAAAQDRLTLKSDPFNEVLRDSAKISGVIVAGVLRHGTVGTEQDGVTLSADLPLLWAGRPVCVRVLSSDGLYESTNEYVLPTDWAGGVAVLSFPSEYSDFLTNLDPQSIAVQISEDTCTSHSTTTAVASWNDSTDTQAPFMLVNSFRADDVFVYVGNDPTGVRCSALTAGGLTAFDHVCKLPSGLTGEVDVTLYRISNGKPANPASTRLWFGHQK